MGENDLTEPRRYKCATFGFVFVNKQCNKKLSYRRETARQLRMSI